jgi:hypothetical protein
MDKNTSLEEILALISSFVGKAISAQEFCTSFENIWNFEADKESIPQNIYERLNSLFDEVVLFSPFPREQWGYPNYRSETDIILAANTAFNSIVSVIPKR